MLHPEIKQQFNAKLLSTPTLKFGDNSSCIAAMLKTVEKLWYKLRDNPKRLARCEKLKNNLVFLYERAKIKEKRREAEANHKTQEFGYHVALPTPLDRDVHSRLRFGRKSGAFKFRIRANYAVHKIQRAK